MSDASPHLAASRAVTIRDVVRAAVERAWERAVASGALPAIPADADPPAVEVERPADPVHGDFASNLAMRLARPYRMAPLAIATALAAELTDGGRRRSGAARSPPPRSPRPGFLNLRLRDDALEATVAAILADPSSWGRIGRRGHGRSVNVEFVSANPTGPLHVGNARGAFVGDLLSRVLEAGGQRVTREYYFNDSGAQIRNLGASVAALRRGEPVPEDGYHGDYVDDLAADRAGRRLGSRDGARSRHRTRSLGQWAAGRVRDGIEASLASARRPLRRLDQRGAAPRRGLGRPRGRAAARARPRLRAGRRDLVPLDRRSATTRTGSSSARTASRPTSRPTSATSPRSSAAASTT